MSDIYLSLTESPTVVTLSQPVVSGVLSSNVTVTNVVSVNVVTMPAINVTAAAPSVTTVAGSVAVSNFPSVTTVAGTVALDANSLSALENVTVTVGAAVSVSNFPSTQTIAGTVTANVLAVDQNALQSALDQYAANYTDGWPVKYSDGNNFPISGTVTAIAHGINIGGTNAVMPLNIAESEENFGNGRRLAVSIIASDGVEYGSGGLPLSVSGTVTIGGIGGSVTIPVRLFAEAEGGPSSGQDTLLNCDGAGQLLINAKAGGASVLGYDGNAFVSVKQVAGSSVTARLQDGSGNNLTSTSIGGLQRLNVSLASAATPGGTLPSFVNVYGGSDGSAVRTISVDSSGRQNINAQFPRVTLIDGSGTVTTANTAITVFASSSTRSYLLVQVTTGSAFVNVGATATTVNGINLTAGQGYAWETTIPQGIVSLISTTTSSRYVAKEA